MIYVSSTYTLLARGISVKAIMLREKRFQYVAKRVGKMMKDGLIGVFSPIAHCHVPSLYHELPKSYEFWKENDHHMIDLCEEVIVLMMPRWEESVGMTDEIKYATLLGKKITYLECPDYEEEPYEYTEDN